MALNPATPLETVRYILPKVDMLLIMTVNPGFGGQKLIPYTLDKVREAKNHLYSESVPQSSDGHQKSDRYIYEWNE